MAFLKPILPLSVALAIGAGGVAAQADGIHTAQLQGRTLVELLDQRARIDDELRRRGVMRSANQLTGVLAEYFFAQAFGWTLARNSQKSFDALHDIVRYQIKARRDYGQSGARQLSAIRNPQGFDYLAVIIFDRFYRVKIAALVPASSVISGAKYVAYTNSYRFSFSDEMLERPEVQDVTEKIRLMTGTRH